ncbi:MAG: TonB-dependent receptor [Vicinamibacterales bacterium]
MSRIRSERVLTTVHLAPSTRRARLLVLGAAAVTQAVPAAAAVQDTQSPRPGAEGLARIQTFQFDIPEGTLDEVIVAVRAITGVNVVIASEELRSLPTTGVRGVMTVEAALALLLSGTPMRATVLADRIEVALAPLSESVSVVGVAARPNVTSPRYTVPLRDVAQTVAIVPRSVIDERAATTLTDVLRNVPGITLQAGEGGGASNTAGDMFNMRGFSANNSLFVDNVRDSGLMARDVFNVEQVEVFMGPSGADVGRGTAAGYVNMATKRPHVGTSMAVSGAVGTASQGRVTADMNWSPAGGGRESWWSRSGFRLNVLWQDRGVPGRDHVKNQGTGIAPAAAFGLGTRTRVFASGQFARQDNVPDYGIPTAGWRDTLLAPGVVQTPQAVRQANYYGSLGYDYDRAEQDAGLLRVEHDVRRNLSVYNQTRINRTHRDAVLSSIQNIAAYAPATQSVTISRQGNERQNTIVSNQTSIVGRFATGSLRHGISGGVEVLREEQFAPGKQGLGTRAAVDIFAPNPRDPLSGYGPGRSLAETSGATGSVAAYANDSVEIGNRWLLAAGFRAERYRTDYLAVDAAGAVTTDLAANGTLLSSRVSTLFRLTPASNIYIAYGTTATPPGESNFQLSATANNVNNPNLEPQRSANLEVGTKVDVSGGRLSLSAAGFRTRNRNIIYTIDATAVPPLFNQDDDQLVRGVTVGALGRITPRWQVLANAAYLDAELQSQGANNGNRLTLTPAVSGSLWTTYLVGRGVSVGGGLQHVGTSWANTANTIRLPAYTLVDGLVEYATNAHLTFRLNISNVTDAVYVRNVNNNGGRYNPGQRRAALLTTSVRF